VLAASDTLIGCAGGVGGSSSSRAQPSTWSAMIGSLLATFLAEVQARDPDQRRRQRPVETLILHRVL
jgi:hypothetical protein